MLKLAARNVFRHTGRTALTLAAIAFGVAGTILAGGFVDDLLAQLRESTIHSQLGHIQIHRVGFAQHGASRPDAYLIDDPTRIIAQVEALPGVRSAMARLAFTGMINNGRSDLPVVGEGVEVDKEAKLGTSVSMVSGRPLAAGDASGILVGEGLASAMKFKPGDHVTLLASSAGGALNTLDFDIAGVFRTFSREYDARAVRIPLAAAQDLLGVSSANAIVVSLARTDSTDAIAATIRTELGAGRFAVKTWHELADFYDKTVDLYRRQFAVLQVIILVAVLLGVANSIGMSVFERTGEFGTLMALGNRPSELFRLVVCENLMLGILGGVAGAVVAVIVALIVSAIGIPMPPPPNSNAGYRAAIAISVAGVVYGIVLGALATTLASLLPAKRIIGLRVVEALRQN